MVVPKVAVICAGHNGNSGMYSVDLAAVRYFTSRNCNFDLYTAQENFDEPFKLDNVTVRFLQQELYDPSYTHIVYWGDFINNPAYGYEDFAPRDVKLGNSPDINSAFDRWQRLFNLSDGKPGAKVISVGNNFQNDLSHYASRYPQVFDRMADCFETILPRDPYSLQSLTMSLPRDTWPRIRQGMDCAFLLDAPARPEPEDYFCYSFGRSKLPGVDKLVSEIEAATGLRGIKVRKWLKLRPKDAHQSFATSRNVISRSRFALSDTYHFLINSMTQGVPVVAVGRSAREQVGTLGDFKKLTLLSMLGLEDRYVTFSDNTSSADFIAKTKKTAVATLDGNGSQSGSYRLMENLIHKFRSDLDFALFGRRA